MDARPLVSALRSINLNTPIMTGWYSSATGETTCYKCHTWTSPRYSDTSSRPAHLLTVRRRSQISLVDWRSLPGVTLALRVFSHSSLHHRKTLWPVLHHGPHTLTAACQEPVPHVTLLPLAIPSHSSTKMAEKDSPTKGHGDSDP